MTQPLLAAQGLRFRYPSGSEIRIPDFSIDAAQTLLVYGQSGSGKSTLLHLVSGLMTQYEGSLRFEGQELRELTPAKMDRLRSESLGNIYQSFNLLPYLNVMENAVLAADLRGENLRERARAMLSQMGLEGFESRAVSELSIGQQQRVAAVRALLMKPRLLLADEPTSSLDTKNKKIFMDLLFALCSNEGTSLLFVSHDSQLQNLFTKRLDLSHAQDGDT